MANSPCHGRPYFMVNSKYFAKYDVVVEKGSYFDFIPHAHDFIELVYTFKGKITHLIDNTEFPTSDDEIEKKETGYKTLTYSAVSILLIMILRKMSNTYKNTDNSFSEILKYISENYNENISENKLADKIHACWIGKNIGGTMGFPYEGTREFLDIQGFVTPKGEPLPNDDLDLHLAWLSMIEQFGIETFDANRLAQAWQMLITPYWAEYGIAKKNMEMGLLPPLSGEFDNDKWRNSNGAWIRSEIWACLAPGFPNVAIKYAIMDASVDHGLGEGTYAEIYTAALESIAFVETDTRKIVETTLEYIQENCRVSQCVRLVLEGYADNYFKRSKYSFDVNDYFDLHTIVEYDENPVVKEGVEFKTRLKFHQLINDKSVQGYVNISLPEGGTAKYSKSVTVFKPFDCYETKEQNVRGVDQNIYI